MIGEVLGYIEKAKESIRNDNFTKFMEHISIAKYLAKENDELAKIVLFEMIDGLYKFHEYKDIFSLIEELGDSIDSEKKIEILRKKGIILGRYGAFEDSQKIFKEFLTHTLPRIRLLGYINLSWVNIYIYQQTLNKEPLHEAKEYCEKGLEILLSYKNDKLHKELLINLGNVYWFSRDYATALNTFQKAAEFEQNDPKILNNIAASYVKLKNAKKAQEYLDKAEKLAFAQNNYFELGQTSLISGKLSEEIIEDYMQAKDSYLTAFDAFINDGAYIEACKCFDNIFHISAKINSESITFLASKLKERLIQNCGQEIFSHSLEMED